MKRKLLLVIGALLMASLMLTSAFAGDLFYARDEATSAEASGQTLNDGTALVTGRCFAKTLIVSTRGNTADSDYLLIYDNTSATGTAKIDVTVGTAGETIVVPLEDMEFGTGVFADAVETHSNMHVTFIYSQ